MLNLRCTDPMSQRAKGTVRGGMAISANNGHAGQGPTLLRANDMHNALAHVVHGVIDHPKFTGVCIESVNLNAALFIVDAF